jgi:hypothetical protein
MAEAWGGETGGRHTIESVLASQLPPWALQFYFVEILEMVQNIPLNHPPK